MIQFDDAQFQACQFPAGGGCHREELICGQVRRAKSHANSECVNEGLHIDGVQVIEKVPSLCRSRGTLSSEKQNALPHARKAKAQHMLCKTVQDVRKRAMVDAYPQRKKRVAMRNP